MRFKILTITILFISLALSAQDDYNSIYAELDILEVSPNPRINGFGFVGVVSSDFYSDAGHNTNPALLTSGDTRFSANISFSPWIRAAVLNNVSSPINHIVEMQFSYRISKDHSIGFQNRLAVGNQIALTDVDGFVQGFVIPYTNISKISYSHTLNKLSVGCSFMYIEDRYGYDVSLDKRISRRTVAGDLGVSYRNIISLKDNLLLRYNIGSSISDFGPKVKMIRTDEKYFIPTKLHLGVLVNPEFTVFADDKINVEFAYEIEKFLIPTPPVLDNNIVFPVSPLPGEDDQIIAGKDPDISIFRALYQSFYDAPYGFREELNEILHKVGLEGRYAFNDDIFLALRVGKFFEYKYKGDRNYYTLGIGAGLYSARLDFFIILDKSSILHKVYGASLGFNFGE